MRWIAVVARHTRQSDGKNYLYIALPGMYASRAQAQAVHPRATFVVPQSEYWAMMDAGMMFDPIEQLVPTIHHIVRNALVIVLAWGVCHRFRLWMESVRDRAA